jgi:uncharacterized membrane protein
MAHAWEAALQRWLEAGLLDGETATRVRAWESSHGQGGVRWPARLALGLGGLLLCAGILLFVAAHWDALSPERRFTLVLSTVAVFHLAGAFTAERSPALAATLHACGTAALGGGIFLAGQIFNLEEHWPGGLMLWAAGAWIGWALLRSWPQALLAAVLTPAWLLGEWIVATERLQGQAVFSVGLLLLALAYLGAEPAPEAASGSVRRALVWLGGLAVIPAAAFLVLSTRELRFGSRPVVGAVAVVGWIAAVGAPLAAAFVLRRRVSAPILAFGAWVAAGPLMAGARGVVPYLWAAGLGLGVVAWGVVERRSERINLGVAGFALTVLVFYFSSVMDKLGRSASLVGLGLLFLGGGWALERARRQLIARVAAA